jgi:hypothetical protein
VLGARFQFWLRAASALCPIYGQFSPSSLKRQLRCWHVLQSGFDLSGWHAGPIRDRRLCPWEVEVAGSHFPPFVVSPSTFLWGRHWLIRLNPYCDSARLESKWHYKGVLKGLSYAIDQRPPFVLTENSPTLWPVQPTLVCFHLVLFVSPRTRVRCGHVGLPPPGAGLLSRRFVPMNLG